MYYLLLGLLIGGYVGGYVVGFVVSMALTLFFVALGGNFGKDGWQLLLPFVWPLQWFWVVKDFLRSVRGVRR